MYEEPVFEVGRSKLPPATRMVLWVTVAAFALQIIFDSLTRGGFTYLFALRRSGLIAGMIWQPVTYMLLHGNWLHILLNMLIVFMFGRELERLLGARRFLLLYIGSGVIGGLGWVMMSARGYCIGASGGVFGLIGMYAALFPNRPITLLLFFVLPITLRARVLALILAAISLVLMFGDGNVAHAAHLAGGLAGYWFGAQLLRQARAGANRSLRRSLADVVGGAMRSARMRPRLTVQYHVPEDETEDETVSMEEIDRLLDKILVQGVGSLTARERRVLEHASKELRDQ
ncbi:MAG: rhomboid family intramembrane serine protease [Kiritimatiellae bacterium]|nr:rhomboid family intramembrane serine protease [Kiritimatiellia bacterium]